MAYSNCQTHEIDLVCVENLAIQTLNDGKGVLFPLTSLQIKVFGSAEW